MAGGKEGVGEGDGVGEARAVAVGVGPSVEVEVGGGLVSEVGVTGCVGGAGVSGKRVGVGLGNKTNGELGASVVGGVTRPQPAISSTRLASTYGPQRAYPLAIGLSFPG